MSVSSDLSVLSDLRRQGELTAEEYSAAKQYVLKHGSLEVPSSESSASLANGKRHPNHGMPEWRRRLNQIGFFVVIAFWGAVGLGIYFDADDAPATAPKNNTQSAFEPSILGAAVTVRDGVACRTAEDFKRLMTLAGQGVAQGAEAVAGCRPYGAGIEAYVVSTSAWSQTATFEFRDGTGLVTQYVTGITAFRPAGTMTQKPSIHYRQADFPDAWPYPPYVDASVKCRLKDGRQMVTVTLGATEYGLNGAALGAGGYPDPRPFVPRDQFGVFENKALGTVDQMMREGLNAC